MYLYVVNGSHWQKKNTGDFSYYLCDFGGREAFSKFLW